MTGIGMPRPLGADRAFGGDATRRWPRDGGEVAATTDRASGGVGARGPKAVVVVSAGMLPTSGHRALRHCRVPEVQTRSCESPALLPFGIVHAGFAQFATFRLAGTARDFICGFGLFELHDQLALRSGVPKDRRITGVRGAGRSGVDPVAVCRCAAARIGPCELALGAGPCRGDFAPALSTFRGDFGAHFDQRRIVAPAGDKRYPRG